MFDLIDKIEYWLTKNGWAKNKELPDYIAANSGTLNTLVYSLIEEKNKCKQSYFVHYTEPNNVDLGDSVYKTDSLEKARDFMDMMENKGLKCKLYLGIEYDSNIQKL